jgi:hypothetical protein
MAACNGDGPLGLSVDALASIGALTPLYKGAHPREQPLCMPRGNPQTNPLPNKPLTKLLSQTVDPAGSPRTLPAVGTPRYGIHLNAANKGS